MRLCKWIGLIFIFLLAFNGEANSFFYSRYAIKGEGAKESNPQCFLKREGLRSTRARIASWAKKLGRKIRKEKDYRKHEDLRGLLTDTTKYLTINKKRRKNICTDKKSNVYLVLQANVNDTSLIDKITNDQCEEVAKIILKANNTRELCPSPLSNLSELKLTELEKLLMPNQVKPLDDSSQTCSTNSLDLSQPILPKITSDFANDLIAKIQTQDELDEQDNASTSLFFEQLAELAGYSAQFPKQWDKEQIEQTLKQMNKSKVIDKIKAKGKLNNDESLLLAHFEHLLAYHKITTDDPNDTLKKVDQLVDSVDSDISQSDSIDRFKTRTSLGSLDIATPTPTAKPIVTSTHDPIPTTGPVRDDNIVLNSGQKTPSSIPPIIPPVVQKPIATPVPSLPKVLSDGDGNQVSPITTNTTKKTLVPTIVDNSKNKNSCTSQDVLKLASTKLKGKDLDKFKEQYHSMFYFDRDKVAMELFTDGTVTSPQTYNTSGEYGIDGYEAAFDHLNYDLGGVQNLKVQDLKELQRRVMSKQYVKKEHYGPHGLPANSEGTLDTDIGIFRVDLEFYRKSQIQSNNLKRLNGEKLLNTTRTYDQIDRDNRFLNISENQVQFPFFLGTDKNNIKDNPELMAMLKPATKQLVIQGGSSLNENKKINQQMLSDLLEYSLNELQQDLKLAIHENDEDKIIQVSARFYRDFMSIHPFANGNGRVGRAILNSALENHGIPSPIWMKWEEDIELSEDQFIKTIYDGIQLSRLMHQNACSRIKKLKEANTGEDLINQLNLSPFLGLDQTHPNNVQKEVTLQDIRQWAEKNNKRLLPADQYGNIRNRVQLDLTKKNFSQLKEDFISDVVNKKPEVQVKYPIVQNIPKKLEAPKLLSGASSLHANTPFSYLNDNDQLTEEQKRKMKIIMENFVKPLEEERTAYTWVRDIDTANKINQYMDPQSMKYRLQSEARGKKTWAEFTNDGFFMGPGIYYSQNPFDSLETKAVYQSNRPQLVKVTINKGAPNINLRDPKTIRGLKERGIKTEDLVTLPLPISIDYPTNFVGDQDNNKYRWGVLRFLTPGSFKVEKANETNMRPEDLYLLTIYKRSGQENNNNMYHAERALKKIKTEWDQNMIKSSGIKADQVMWAPYGKCVQKTSTNEINELPNYKLCLEQTGATLVRPDFSQNPILKRRIQGKVLRVKYPNGSFGPYVDIPKNN